MTNPELIEHVAGLQRLKGFPTNEDSAMRWAFGTSRTAALCAEQTKRAGSCEKERRLDAR
jgi:hypothetical protein